MTHSQFQKFLSFLERKGYFLWAPQKEGKEVVIKKLEKENISKFRFQGKLPFWGWKNFLLPPCHSLFRYKKNRLFYLKPQISPQILLGMAPLDLKALVLYNQVFEKDPWYQEIKKKTIVVGQSLMTKEKYQFFIEKFEEDTLEHLPFDIFFIVHPKGRKPYKIFTGSEEGQKLLDEFGYINYEHVDYMGPNPEEGFDQKMAAIKKAMEERFNPEIWEDLGKRCIECGKCTIACPTCFCFDIWDKPGKKEEEGERIRCLTSCFYQEFSEIAGGYKFLKTTAERIYFWYEHHFVRMPNDYGVVGCVACGRCSKVCPVGINIFKVIQKILKS